MPQAAYAFVTWMASGGVGATVFGFGLKIFSYIAVGLIVGKVARALGLMQGPGGLNSTNPLQLNRDPVAARRVIYGRTRVSGTMLDALLTGSTNEYLHMVCSLAGHECEAIEDVYFNDEVVPLDGAGNATGTLAGFARVKKHLGTTGQIADADFVADSGGQRAGTDRFDQIAYLYLRYKWDQNKFPGGFPNPSAVVKGKKVYDPRTGLTVWSDNVALCLRDYLVNADYGLKVNAATEIDEDSFIAAANICDEPVTLAAGGTEPRYTCNGSFEVSAQPATVLEKMKDAMAGDLVFVSGKWICYAGAHRSPSLTFDEDDLRGGISIQTKLSMRDTCNGVRGVFTSPADRWQVADFTPITNAFYLGEDGGDEIWRDIELPFTTSQATAQRIAKIELERTRQDISLTMPCKLTALRAKPGDVIMVNNTRLGWSAKQFTVTELKFSIYDEAGSPALGVDLSLRETAAEVWDWNDGEETTYDPAPNTSLGDPRSVPTPAALALATFNFKQSDGTISPRLKVTWDAPADQFVTSGGWAHVEYKQSADSDWLIWNAKVRGAATEEYITDVLAGIAYDVRVAFENVQRVVGAYASASATVSTDTTAPAVPESLTAISSPGSVSLDWPSHDPVADSDYVESRLYRNTVNNPATAVLIWAGRASGYTDFRAGSGTKYYWATRVDATNNESAKSVVASGAANPATGNKIVNVFARAASTPSAPTGDYIPVDWFDAPPAADGNPLWISTAEVTSTGILVGIWSTPVRLDGYSISVEYSIDGASLWHDTFTGGDIYMRQKVGDGAWSSAIRIVGEVGPTGATGATGDTGPQGPGILYRGSYDGSKTYYHTAVRRDVVEYSGTYYLANNQAKNGLNTWGTPGGGDWTIFSTDFESVATKLLLAEDATITKNLVIGGGGSDGLIRSYNYDPGVAGWAINAVGQAEFNDITVRVSKNAGGSGSAGAVVNNSTTSIATTASQTWDANRLIQVAFSVVLHNNSGAATVWHVTLRIKKGGAIVKEELFVYTVSGGDLQVTLSFSDPTTGGTHQYTGEVYATVWSGGATPPPYKLDLNSGVIIAEQIIK